MGFCHDRQNPFWKIGISAHPYIFPYKRRTSKYSQHKQYRLWATKHHHNFEPASMADPAPIENTPYKGSRGGSRGPWGFRGAPVGAVGGF